MPFATRPCPARLALLPALAVLLLAGPALAESFADQTLTRADMGRLARADQTREAAVAEARAGGGAADVAELTAVLAAPPKPILGVDIRGDYRCRTLKLGGILPLTVYGWFACKIDEDDIGYRLTKTNGSQRLSGNFIDEATDRLLYYGTTHTAGDQPGNYGDDADRDQVGYFIKTGPTSYRLELPEPRVESNFDILELQRK